MTEEGVICKIDRNEVTIIIEKECEGGCHTCSQNKERRFNVVATNAKHLDLKVGNKVEIFVPPAKVIKTGFMVLILPLILFIALYVLTDLLLGIREELFKILSGLGGVALSFVGLFVMRKFKNREDLPEVLRIVE
ncbi:MAG: SoxR reducing system RseC family protein [Spirochaetales bacterium]|nr:SoxR reducing system RseC family protein [Spirochaetales bacterium]